MRRSTELCNQWTSSVASTSLSQFQSNINEVFVKRLTDLEKSLDSRDRPILGALKGNSCYNLMSSEYLPSMDVVSTHEIVHEEDDDDEEGNDDGDDDDTRVIDDDQSDMIVDNGGILEESSDDNDVDT